MDSWLKFKARIKLKTIKLITNKCKKIVRGIGTI